MTLLDAEAHSSSSSTIVSNSFTRLANVYGAADADGRYVGFWSDPFSRKDFARAELRTYLPRLGAALAIFFTGLFINNLSQAWLQKEMAGYYETHWAPVVPEKHNVTLWDVSFKYLPYVKTTTPCDVFAAGAPLFCILRFAVMPGPMSLRWTIVCRYLTIWGILWFCRAFTIVTTPLPNPDKSCKPKITFPDSIFMEALANMPFLPMFSEMTCQDILYSGHTVALTLATLITVKYVRHAPWLSPSNDWCSVSTACSITWAIATLTGYFFIIASHFHYTVDVLVGSLMTVLVFNYYHTCIHFAVVRKRKSRLCFWPFLRWFEGPAKDLQAWRRKELAEFAAAESCDV